MNTLRFAWRSLARSPGFVAISVLALGLGLGLSTTMFAVLDAVVNPEVAYRDPGTLFSINWWFGRRNPMQPAELYRYFRDQTRSFAVRTAAYPTPKRSATPGRNASITTSAADATRSASPRPSGCWRSIGTRCRPRPPPYALAGVSISPTMRCDGRAIFTTSAP